MSIFALQALLLCLFLFGANAGQVQPTQKIEGAISANPRPTPRAIAAEAYMNLFGRQDYQTVCGYDEGNINYPEICPAGYVCATANHYNAVRCCDPNALASCEIPSTCIPYRGVCNSACSADNLYYTSCGSLAPYCFTKIFEYGEPYYEYECATAPGILTVLSTATGTSLTHTSTTPSPVAVTHSSSPTPATLDLEPTSLSTPVAVTHTTSSSSATTPTSLSSPNSPSPSSVVASPAAITETTVVTITTPNILTSPSTAGVSPPSSVSTPSPIVITESKFTSSPATPVPDSATTGTGGGVSCGNDSECGNGSGDSGSSNGIHNGSSGASMRVRSPSISIIVALVYGGILIFL